MLQLDWRRPTWTDIALGDELALSVDAAVADAADDGATQVSAGPAGGGRRLADPASTGLLLQCAAGGTLPGEVRSVHQGFFITEKPVVASSGSPCVSV
jgi:hypothetical protein